MQIVHMCTPTYVCMCIHMHIYPSPVGHGRAEIKSKMKMVMSPPGIAIWCSSEWSMQIKHDNKLMRVWESVCSVCAVCAVVLCWYSIGVLNFYNRQLWLEKADPKQADLLSASTMEWMCQRIWLKLFELSLKISIKAHVPLINYSLQFSAPQIDYNCIQRRILMHDS